MASGLAGASPATPVNPSTFGTIEHAAQNIATLHMRLDGIVTRLCGSVPESASTGRGDIKGVPNGLLDVAGEFANGINSNAFAMGALLDRLEKQLP